MKIYTLSYSLEDSFLTLQTGDDLKTWTQAQGVNCEYREMGIEEGIIEFKKSLDLGGSEYDNLRKKLDVGLCKFCKIVRDLGIKECVVWSHEYDCQLDFEVEDGKLDDSVELIYENGICFKFGNDESYCDIEYTDCDAIVNVFGPKEVEMKKIIEVFDKEVCERLGHPPHIGSVPMNDWLEFKDANGKRLGMKVCYPLSLIEELVVKLRECEGCKLVQE